MKRTLEHIKALRVAGDGKSVELGLGIRGTPGATVVVETDSLSQMAFALLAMGQEAERNGHFMPNINAAQERNVLGCTQLALMSTDGETSALVMRFGATELAVRFHARDLKTALSLIEKQSSGGILPASGTQH